MKDNLRFISFSLRGGDEFYLVRLNRKRQISTIMEAFRPAELKLSTHGISTVETDQQEGFYIYRRPLIFEKHPDHIPEQSRTQAETHWGLQQHLNILATPATWVWRTMPTWRDLGRSCRRRGRGWRGWKKRWRRKFFYLKSTFYLEITGEGENEARGTKPRGEAARSVTSKTSNAGTKTKTSKASN